MHLSEIGGAARAPAEEHLRRFPGQIITEYRRLIAAGFGWT